MATPPAPGLRRRKLFLFVSLPPVTLMVCNFWLMGRQFSANSPAGGEALGWMNGLSHLPPDDAVGNWTKTGEKAAGATRGNLNATASKSTPSNAAAAAPPRLRGAVVIQLMGELGNHLSSLAYFFAVRTIARDEFGLDLVLHVRKQRNSKAEVAAQNVRCLKSFRDLDFDECDLSRTNGTSRGSCEAKLERQQSSLFDLMRERDNVTIMVMASNLFMKGSSPDDIRARLRNYEAMLKDDSIMGMYREKNLGWSDREPYPVLFSDERPGPSWALVNEMYGRGLREYLGFDDRTKASSGCCSALPKEDEHVFHYRSFISDLPTKHMAWGGAELAPGVAAGLLSASLPPGTKIALVGGRANPDRVEAYEAAFRNRSFVVRRITGQSPIQDFCFLAHARAGLWGTARSTFVEWASLINGDLRNATLYGVNYRAREAKAAGRVTKNVDLARIVHFPVFDLSDDDVW